MSTPLLVIDSHYLCHRAFHSSGHLSWQGVSTGVAFGFLKSIGQFKDEFATDRVAFCFEGQNLLRRRIYADYKHRRHNKERSTEEQKSYENLAIQINQLRAVHLPKIGFKNIFCYPTYESDDIMAVIAANASEKERIILITSDSDLYQCLRPNVDIYSPQKSKLFTEHWFRAHYGIAPAKWAVVKALAGCDSDNVPGIRGVGEATALKFVQGKLPQGSKAYDLIMCKEGRKTVRRNRELVELPFEGCPVPQLQEDKISGQGWMGVCRGLGMKSLAAHPPIAKR